MSSATQAVLQANNEFNAAISQQKGSVLDKDSFMLLLVTQFKYQDPLNPMEDKEFVSQLSQFSSLEQLMNLNTSMEGLTQASNNQQMINATSYIGKQVTVSGNAVGKVTDATTGTATITRFRYAPQDTVASGMVTVYDQYNNIVYTEPVASKSAGVTYQFNWDGKDNTGQTLPDGVYRVGLSLLNAKGEAVLSDQVVDATVTGVVNDRGMVYLGLEGGQLMSLSDVREVVMPKTVPSTSAPDGASDIENVLNALLDKLQNGQSGTAGTGESAQSPPSGDGSGETRQTDAAA